MTDSYTAGYDRGRQDGRNGLPALAPRKDPYEADHGYQAYWRGYGEGYATGTRERAREAASR